LLNFEHQTGIPPRLQIRTEIGGGLIEGITWTAVVPTVTEKFGFTPAGTCAKAGKGTINSSRSRRRVLITKSPPSTPPFPNHNSSMSERRRMHEVIGPFRAQFPVEISAHQKRA
jgi:hypothetical protein